MLNFVSSLRSRLILAILLAVIPAFGLNLYSAANHRELTAAQAKQNALIAARIIAAEQDRVLENAHQFLVTLANVPQIHNSDKSTCHKFLSKLLEPRYADLTVADRNGNPLCTALSSDAIPANPKALQLSRGLDSRDFAVGKVRYQPETSKAVLDVSYPILEAPGVVRGYISAALDLSWINYLIVDQHLDPGITYTLVNDDGIVLLRYPVGSWIGKSLYFDRKEASVISQSNERTVELKTPDGLRRLFAFSRLKNSMSNQPVYAAIDLPISMASAKSREILIRDSVSFGLLSIVVLALAWFGTDVFVLRRIRDIIAATNKVAAGNLKARTTYPYQNNELGQMARAFDHLAQALETRQTEAEKSAKRISNQQQQQTALFDLIRGITSTLDVRSVLNIFLDHISALFPAYAVSVSCINGNANGLDAMGYRLPPATDQLRSDPYPPETLPNLVLKQQSPVAIANARMDPRVRNHDFFRDWTSYLGLPMVAKQEILGVVSFCGKEERELSPGEITFLNGLVNEAAIAIYNSRLFEQIREQATELERSNKIKDEFLGVMSHELRTPLNIIMNYAEALQMGTFGEITATQESATDKIRVQASSLLLLINGVLEITKIESGSIVVQRDAIDMTEFMHDNRSDYMLLGEKNLTVEWDIPAQLPTIVSDRLKLKQILTNLINNALKFTDQGSVKISARIAADQATLELCVSDTGPGIPEEMLPIIFDKFRQLDSATTRNYGGAGLGLFIVRNFVTLLGGTIEVTSQMGEGSAFKIYLPIRQELPEGHPAMPDQMMRDTIPTLPS